MLFLAPDFFKFYFIIIFLIFLLISLILSWTEKKRCAISTESLDYGLINLLNLS